MIVTGISTTHSTIEQYERSRCLHLLSNPNFWSIINSSAVTGSFTVALVASKSPWSIIDLATSAMATAIIGTPTIAKIAVTPNIQVVESSGILHNPPVLRVPIAKYCASLKDHPIFLVDRVQNWATLVGVDMGQNTWTFVWKNHTYFQHAIRNHNSQSNQPYWHSSKSGGMLIKNSSSSIHRGSAFAKCFFVFLLLNQVRKPIIMVFTDFISKEAEGHCHEAEVAEERPPGQMMYHFWILAQLIPGQDLPWPNLCRKPTIQP